MRTKLLVAVGVLVGLVAFGAWTPSASAQPPVYSNYGYGYRNPASVNIVTPFAAFSYYNPGSYYGGPGPGYGGYGYGSGYGYGRGSYGPGYGGSYYPYHHHHHHCGPSYRGGYGW